MTAWAAGLFLCIFSGCSIASEDETTLVETSFAAYETRNHELRLFTPAGETYIIEFYDDYNGCFDNPAFLCDGNPYTVRVTSAGYICSLTNPAGEHIITVESQHEAYRNSQRAAVVLLAAMLLLTAAFFALALVVSNNPERYPAWLVKLLFARASDFWS